MIREFLIRLRFLLIRKRETELDEELQFHFEQSIAAKVAAGLSASEARRLAMIEFGGVDAIREQCEQERPGWWLSTVVQDCKYAMRGIRRNPLFSIAVVVTLMIGIGSTSTIFSVVDGILFRPLPYGDASRLVSVGLIAPIEPQEFMLGGSYYEWQEHQKPFVAMTSETGVEHCDLNEVNPVQLDCAAVESNFLPTMGISPVIGRNFLPNEDRPNGPKVALISYALWRTRFDRNQSALGKTIRIDGIPTEIVGVLPRDFEMPRLQSADVLLPEALDVAAQRRANPGRPMWAFARLKPGITVSQAKAQLEPLFQYSLNQAPPQFRKEVHYTVRPLRDRQFHDVHRAAWILLGLVMAVLLIACANVASLLIARRASREHEIAIREALGAGRMRLIQQAVAESFVLSIVGGLAGVFFAMVLRHVLIAAAPSGLPFLSAAKIDSRVLAFTVLASLACAIGLGLVLGSIRSRADALTSHNRAGVRHTKLRQVLVTTEIAASLLLLAGGALLTRSFWNLQEQNLGVNDENVLTATMSLGRTGYPTPEKQMEFFNRLAQDLRYAPGVLEVAISDSLPPGGYHHDQIYASLRVDGDPPFASGTGGNVAWRWVTPDYFRALGIPVVEGDGFTDDELSSSGRFIVLSRSLAERMFPQQSPLGRQVHVATGAPADLDPPYTVVGVAADVKNGGLAVGEEPEYYRLRRNRAEDWNDWNRGMAVIVKSSLPPAGIEARLRQQIASMDSTLPFKIGTLRERVGRMADRPRFEMLVVGYFACAGLILAIVGLYGVISFLMVQRKQEIGVRMALGASRADILRMVLASALRMIVPGAAIGLAVSIGVSRVFESLLFRTGPHDPVAFVGATTVLVLIAVLASVLPAVVAARVDPMVSLRVE